MAIIFIPQWPASRQGFRLTERQCVQALERLGRQMPEGIDDAVLEVLEYGSPKERVAALRVVFFAELKQASRLAIVHSRFNELPREMQRALEEIVVGKLPDGGRHESQVKALGLLNRFESDAASAPFVASSYA